MRSFGGKSAPCVGVIFNAPMPGHKGCSWTTCWEASDANDGWEIVWAPGPPITEAFKKVANNQVHGAVDLGFYEDTSLEECLGGDAVLYELAALVSEPGAPPQPFHPDTRYDPALAVLTCFVALQPIVPTHGSSPRLIGKRVAHLVR